VNLRKYFKMKRDKDVSYESKKFTKKGSVYVYDLDMNFISGKKYNSSKDRNSIIESWNRLYPNKRFYIVIKPTL